MTGDRPIHRCQFALADLCAAGHDFRFGAGVSSLPIGFAPQVTFDQTALSTDLSSLASVVEVPAACPRTSKPGRGLASLP